MTEDLSAAERALGYTFKDKSLLTAAFTHSSYAYLHGTESNERLEFLGDSVLQLAVTERLYKTVRKDEGELTDLRRQYVSRAALDKAEEKLSLMRFLLHHAEESALAGKTRSNLFEAVVGAIYLDGGMDAAKRFLEKHLVRAEREDYKSALQELVQERAKTPPAYTVTEAEGGFRCRVTALGVSADGEGTSKKSAETQAAKKLYETLKNKKS